MTASGLWFDKMSSDKFYFNKPAHRITFSGHLNTSKGTKNKHAMKK